MSAKSLYIGIVVSVLGWTSIASADLAARWTFNNNGNDQVGALNWTLNGGASYSTDRKEGSHSLQLDGVDDYAALPGSGLMSDTFTVKTVLLWFKPNSTVGTQVIYEEGGASNGLAIRIKDGVLEAVTKTNPDAFRLSTPLAGTGWSHVAASFDNGSFRLYLNGALVGSTATTFTQVASHTNASAIGGRNGSDTFNDSSGTGYFGGLIDDVQVYNEALSETKILEITTVGPVELLKARRPSPENGGVGVSSPLFQWTAGDEAKWHNLYLGASPELGAENLVGIRLINSTYYHVPGLTPGVAYWWRVDEIKLDGTVTVGDVWSFTFASTKAWSPAPSDGEPYADQSPTLTWEPGLSGSFHDVYFGADRNAVTEGAADAFKGNQGNTSYTPGVLPASTTYYWRVDEIDAAGNKEIGDVWSFTTLPPISIVDPNLVGWWTFDEEAGTRAVDWSGHGHHAEFNGAGSPTRTAGYDGGALAFAGAASDEYLATSYSGIAGTDARSVTAWIKTATFGEIISWGLNAAGQKWILRVQESNGIVGAIRVEVNGGYQVGYTDVRDDEWHHVAAVLASGSAPDAVDVKLYVDGSEETSSASQDEPVNTAGTGVVRIGESPWHNRPFTGLIDDVRLYNKVLNADELGTILRIDPALAWEPQPASGALVDVRDASELNWSAGYSAAKHDVYFGRDEDAVTSADTGSAVYHGRRAGTNFALDELVEFGGGSYYWRIDEVEADGVTINRGLVWTLTVPDYLAVDDFESYNDDDNRIYSAWIDGYTNGTGAWVGYSTSPFAEHAIIHSGTQSLPLDYNNVNSPYYSETTREFGSVQNWTTEDVTNLVLFVRGSAGNTADSLYIGIQDSAGKLATVTYPDSAIVEATAWTEWRIPLSSLAGVNLAKVDAVHIGVGNRTSPTAGGVGILYIDDIRLTK